MPIVTLLLKRFQTGRDRMLEEAKSRISSRVSDKLAQLRPLGVQARHAEISAIASLDDELSKPSDRLLDIAERVLPAARCVSMNAVSNRITSGPRYPDVWPGEHYKLLAGLVKVTGAKRVVEIGTYQGYGTLAMMQTLPDDGQIAGSSTFWVGQVVTGPALSLPTMR